MIGGRNIRKLVLLGAAAALVASTVGMGSAMAADTRNVYVGDPSGDGELHLTPASSGNSTAFAVLVENRTNQTEAHPTLTVDEPVAAFHGADASYCSAATKSCAFPNLAGFASRSVTVEIATPTDGPLDVTVTLTVNESGNPNGSNQQIFSASGSTTVFPTTDDAAATFFAPGKAALLSTKPGANKQSAEVSIPNSNGHAIAIVEGQEPAEFCTGAGVTCFGQATSLTINFGATIDPYAEVTLFWAADVLPKGFNPKFAGVAHQLDDGTVVTIPNDTKKFGCSASRPVDCVVGSSYVNKVGFTMTVRVPQNGYVKGYR